MRIIDLSYHGSYLDSTAEEYLEKARPNTGYSQFLKRRHDVSFVFHSGYTAELKKDGVNFFFRKKLYNSRLLPPFALSVWIMNRQPDVVLVHSIIYMHFAVFLKLFLPSDVKIFIQHHAEKVPKGRLKRELVGILDRFIEGYLFTTKSLAEPWVRKGLISNLDKVYEVMEGSSTFTTRPKQVCRRALGIPNEKTFIWVGRLNANKDPMCAIRAFHAYAAKGHLFKFYMFYHTGELLETIKDYISANGLEKSIVLMGQRPRSELESWYNAADFFISASRSEGSGYALCEAMSCGCVPIVSDIPSFRYITDDGQAGFLFGLGDHKGLYDILERIGDMDLSALKTNVLATFGNRLSFKAIALKMEGIFTSEK